MLLIGYLLAGVAGLQAQWDVPEGLYLGPLRTWLRSNTYVGQFDDLGYNGAREQMFGLTDNNSGTVTCVYTGFSQPAAFTTYLDPINTEHIVPQSFFGGISPMRSDLYNMLPCHSSANSARNNSQYGEVGDATAQWYGISGSGAYVTQGNIPANPDAWSERSGEVWEPRESQKGNIARMVFYFYTMYPDAAGAITQMGSTATLYQWHLADPPDATEILRNTRVASVQGNRNPYVDMPELVYLAWMYNGTPVLGCTQVNACNYLPAATHLKKLRLNTAGALCWGLGGAGGLRALRTHRHLGRACQLLLQCRDLLPERCLLLLVPVLAQRQLHRQAACV